MIGLEKNSNPLISVIVPVYNTEKYLKTCVESICKQTYKNLEIFLIDDGSTDKSGVICDLMAQRDSRIVVMHKKNGGVSSARNIGLDNSTGEYVMFVDSDDLIPQNSVEVLINSLLKYDADVVSGIDQGKRQLNLPFEIIEGEQCIVESLKDNPYFYSVWAKIFSKKIISDVRFDSDIRINEDSFFMFELTCAKPKFIRIPQEVYCYCENPYSASRSKFSDKFFDIILVADEKYSIIQESFPNLLKYAENMKIKSRMSLLKLLAERTNGEYENLEKQYIKSVKESRRFYVYSSITDNIWFFMINNHMFGLYKFFKRIFNMRKKK